MSSASARSIRHRDMGTIRVTTPSFSVGSSSVSSTTPAVAPDAVDPPVAPVAPPPRRSTRRAARAASALIREDARPHRCPSWRVIPVSRARNNAGLSSSTAARRVAASSSPTMSPGRARTAASAASQQHGSSKESAIVLSSGDDDIDEMNLKPAAKKAVAMKGVANMAASSASSGDGSQKPPEDFTCAICLDAPATMNEVATISGCTHRFCFDCIDKWAKTENKCPCCKQRFRTIDRAVPLPAEASPRRGKRKRQAAAAASNARARRAASASPARRVNSRTVEDRNQQTVSAFPINAAIVEQILASFTSFGGRGQGQVTFGTSEDGRPQIRMIRPQGGGMVGVMEMFLPQHAEPGATLAGASAGGSGAARGPGAARGSSTSPGTARVRFERAPGSGSRRESGIGSASTAFSFGASMPPSLSSSSASERASAARRAAARPPSAASATSASARSSFASLFNFGASPPGASPRLGRRAASGAAAAPPAGAVENGAEDRANRMTIRFVTRERGATSGSGRSSSRSRSPRRAAREASGNGNNDAGTASDEPIIID